MLFVVYDNVYPFLYVVASYNFANLSLIAKIVWLLDRALAMYFVFTEHPHLYVITMSVISNAEITPCFIFFILLLSVICPQYFLSLSLSLQLCLSFFLSQRACSLHAGPVCKSKCLFFMWLNS